MRTSLRTYEAKTEFRSKGLKKSFKPGDQIKAPKSIGDSWLTKGIAIEIKTSKQ